MARGRSRADKAQLALDLSASGDSLAIFFLKLPIKALRAAKVDAQLAEYSFNDRKQFESIRGG